MSITLDYQNLFSFYLTIEATFFEGING